ncbi:MAG: folate-binding protein [Pseudomonadota bacterium]
MTDRSLFLISGTDRVRFLQNLVTNSVGEDMPLTYAALLTPQGKYIADFFLTALPAPFEDALLLDIATDLADDLVRRLMLYKLRADVEIAPAPLHVHRGLGQVPQDGWADPRHAELGWRAYRDAAPTQVFDADWTALRVDYMVPEAGFELTEDSYILEMGFERLNGVDFRKGCYVGQEVTARMKHKTELRKGLAQLEVPDGAKAGDALEQGGKPAGTLHTVVGTKALAYLRFDRSEGLSLNGQPVTRLA